MLERLGERSLERLQEALGDLRARTPRAKRNIEESVTKRGLAMEWTRAARVPKETGAKCRTTDLAVLVKPRLADLSIPEKSRDLRSESQGQGLHAKRPIPRDTHTLPIASEYCDSAVPSRSPSPSSTVALAAARERACGRVLG